MKFQRGTQQQQQQSDNDENEKSSVKRSLQCGLCNWEIPCELHSIAIKLGKDTKRTEMEIYSLNTSQYIYNNIIFIKFIYVIFNPFINYFKMSSLY